MDLLTYARARRGAIPALARTLKVTPGFLWQCAQRKRPVPPAMVPRMERGSGGALCAETLRPDITWLRVPDKTWPHPQGRPVADMAGDERQAA